jgi:sugar O-acyltransferase (sialic acid O-acetyltransferase NeuD family)
MMATHMAQDERPLVIIGTGGQGRCALDIALQCDRQVMGFVDAVNPDHVGRSFNGVRVIADLAGLDDVVSPKAADLIVAYGTSQEKQTTVAALAGRFVFSRLISPQASVAKDVLIGAGSIIYPMAVVQPNAQLGEHVKVGPSSVVSHDNIFGNFVNVTTGCSLGGRVTLEEGVTLNTGVNIVPGVTIGAWTTVGAGALVMKNTGASELVYGVPAGLIRSLE